MSGQTALQTDALQHLRLGTQELHRTLDDAVSRFDLTSESGYHRFLQMHARVLPPLEHWLSTQPLFLTLPHASRRFRAATLREDLEALPVKGHQSDDIQFEVQGMSFLNDKTAVPGISYVLEGSRLGGALLSARIRKARPDMPLCFLEHGRGERFWTTFLSWLSNLQMTELEMDSATLAAREVFEAYLRALQRD